MIRLPIFLATIAAAVAPAAAQTVRFDTSVGAFDLTLNPTNDPNLQPLVDNLIANVGAGNYRGVVVNRADTDFVLQLGSFETDTLIPGPLTGAVGSAPSPVDADNDGAVDFPALSNTRGTVSLALSAAGPNSGSLSFFVNVADNGGLDGQGFVPFAEVSDLTVVDSIFELDQIDISALNGSLPGSLPFVDTPVDENGNLILIETVTVLSDDPFVFINPLRVAAGIEPLTIAQAAVAQAISLDDPLLLQQPAFLEPPVLAASTSDSAVPEPSALGLLACSLLTAAGRRRR